MSKKMLCLHHRGARATNAIEALYPESNSKLAITLNGKEKDLIRYDELKGLIAELQKSKMKLSKTFSWKCRMLKLPILAKEK